jgi:hypothetical protein
MTLDKSLTAVCLRSSGRYILITCDIHRPLWLFSAYGELKWLSRETLCQAGLLSRATARNSCRKNIGLTKLSPQSTLHHKVADRQDILLRLFLLLCLSAIRGITKQLLIHSRCSPDFFSYIPIVLIILFLSSNHLLSGSLTTGIYILN